MKVKIFSITFFTAILTACSSTPKGNLPSQLYQGYWAMYPFNGQHRVLKFQPNGVVKIYDYTCNYKDGSYRLYDTDTVYLRKLGNKRFKLFDRYKKPFSQFEIMRLNSQFLDAKQVFNEPKQEKGSLNLRYFATKIMRPICRH
ncbi:hypothetical protein A4G19_14850 [Pasteurellaceae bacterium Macca]|nr:hypothetical protein [Pasteurellaceae bacterium Macca]